jgi:hypothetical protein
MPSVDAWAFIQAKRHLAPLGRRFSHVQGVAARAQLIGPTVVGEHSERLLAAAMLHDIGYAPRLATSGFHPLDGARFCRNAGYPQIASLIAHHTGARNEAQLRGLLPQLLDEFPYEDSLMQRALTYCDLTTAPDGTRTNVNARVVEICERYGGEHVVSRAIQIGLPEFLAIEAEIETLLALSGSPVSSARGSQSPAT